MSEHTPGPWLCGSRVIESADGEAVVIAGKDMTFANAKLIAAAPDMLAALKAMVEAHGGSGDSPEVKAAAIAIAKAEGRL